MGYRLLPIRASAAYGLWQFVGGDSPGPVDRARQWWRGQVPVGEARTGVLWNGHVYDAGRIIGLAAVDVPEAPPDVILDDSVQCLKGSREAGDRPGRIACRTTSRSTGCKHRVERPARKHPVVIWLGGSAGAVPRVS
jgi:hypothetical protein